MRHRPYSRLSTWGCAFSGGPPRSGVVPFSVHPRRQVLPFQEINKKANSLMATSVSITPRVPWTARRPKQSILKEISPEYSLQGLMLRLKLQYFGHLM